MSCRVTYHVGWLKDGGLSSPGGIEKLRQSEWSNLAISIGFPGLLSCLPRHIEVPFIASCPLLIYADLVPWYDVEPCYRGKFYDKDSAM